MRVRKIVGHSVSSVPATVNPTKPSTLVASCANRTRACHGADSPAASTAPSTAPTGNRNAATT